MGGSEVRIALAQTKPKVGCLKANLADHIRFTQLAVDHGCECIVFPELSLMGYEPELAQSFAIRADDVQLDQLQKLSNESGCRISFGAPLLETPFKRQLPRIVSVTFAPFAQPTTYCKRLLHPDELPFFSAGQSNQPWLLKSPKVALVICFELTDDALIRSALRADAELLIASVAKHKDGMDSAHVRLHEIAASFQVPTMIVNSLGLQDGMNCCGDSAAWNRNGRLVSQLGDEEEGLLMVDFAESDLAPFKVLSLPSSAES
jgi:predicted amidohydrolase